MDNSNLNQQHTDVLNGRVDLSSANPSHHYQLYQQDELEKKTSNEIFSAEAIKTLQTKNALSSVYFSPQNIALLQNQIRHQVWQQSNNQHVISNQSDLQLQIVMRSIYLQYSRNLPEQITEQIENLNHRVMNYCVPNILSGIEQYVSYRKDVSQLPTPMEHPEHMSSAGKKSLIMSNFL